MRVARAEPSTGSSDIVSGRLLLLGKRNAYIERGEGDARELVVVAHRQVEIARPSNAHQAP